MTCIIINTWSILTNIFLGKFYILTFYLYYRLFLLQTYTDSSISQPIFKRWMPKCHPSLLKRHILGQKTRSTANQKYQWTPIFYVSWHYGITLWCTRPCEQLLLQNYKAQRHAVFFLQDTLTIEDEKVFKACRSVCLSVLQSHYKWGIPTQNVKISKLYHKFLIHCCRNFSLILHIWTRSPVGPLCEY